MSTAVSNEELSAWADKRADDAGRLARELIVYRQAAMSTAEPVSDPFATFRTGFCLQESGDGKYRITISYRTMADMHKAFDELAAALSHVQAPGDEDA